MTHKNNELTLYDCFEDSITIEVDKDIFYITITESANDDEISKITSFVLDKDDALQIANFIINK